MLKENNIALDRSMESTNEKGMGNAEGHVGSLNESKKDVVYVKEKDVVDMGKKVKMMDDWKRNNYVMDGSEKGDVKSVVNNAIDSRLMQWSMIRIKRI